MNNKSELVNKYSFDNIRNIYESKVINQIKVAIYEFEAFDGCDNCLRDVYALALSRIPATYAITEDHSNFACLPDGEILEVVRYAIYRVMKKPNHKI